MTTETKQQVEKQNIFVSCRFRPINAQEIHDEKNNNIKDNKYAIEISSNQKDVTIQRGLNNNSSHNDVSTLKFSFDHILSQNSTQQQTFDTIGKPLIDHVCQGYNGTIFAYGRTGSGKSFTMFGDANYSNLDDIGIIPRSIDYLFEKLEINSKPFQINISVIECDKHETLQDLLNNNNNNKNNKLEIYLSSTQLYVKNIIEQECKTCIDAISCIIEALKNRHIKTKQFINKNKNGSHMIVTLTIKQKIENINSKLRFVDLAGSELLDKSKATGKSNQGLLALSQVIIALAQSKKFIPYQSSKLTKLLSDSLGGNSKTHLIVTCSTHISCKKDTIATLRFAQKAKQVKNLNNKNKKKTILQLEKQVIELQIEMESIKQEDNNNNNNEEKMRLLIEENNKLKIENE
eukprot:376538_1